MSNEEMKKRILSEQTACSPIKLENLVCKDCIFRVDDKIVAYCEKFSLKSKKILNGGDCDEYVKD